MTAAERLQAAIEKLEREADTYSPRPWTAWRQGAPGRQRFGIEDARAEDVATVREADDAELMVTLSRTIEPQLAILREVRDRYAVLESWEPKSPTAINALRLADAILGGAQ